MPARYLEPADVTAERASGAIHLRITIREDRCLLNAKVKRVFPLSDPSRYLSIQDGEGKEVGVLKSLDGLDADSHRLLEEELDRRYFTPQIERIERLVMEAGMWHFNVQTQRGPTEFYVRNWRDSAVEIGAGRWQIHSVDGGRFEIPNLDGLDPTSQRLMDQLL